jgi:hypothetical protein
MADSWDGFIADDYRLVMPVPWRKKYGIKYCYNVPFIQQLGVFGKNFKPEEVDPFINKLNETFSYGDYAFNYLNQVKTAKQSNNYILLLSSKYEVLKQFYLSHLEKNLHKAKKFSLQYEAGEIQETIELFKKIYANRIKNITAKDYESFSVLCKLKQQENEVVVRKITSNNQLLASVLLMKYERRYYNLMMCVTETARQQSAGAVLYNELIKEFSYNGMMIDFEGSDIAGIEFFYKGFGAVNQPYYKLHLNTLPFPLRLFKR